MRLLTALFFVLLLGSGQIFAKGAPKAAATPAPAPAPDAAASSAPPGTLEIKNKSSFTMESGSRNPFWPIGWKPSGRMVDPNATEHAGPDIAPSAFLVSSIAMGGRGHRFAIINGKIMEEGQQFGLQVGSQTYQLTVKSILDGKVVLSKRDQEIVVPLRRK